jgi:type II secretory pathway component PulL
MGTELPNARNVFLPVVPEFKEVKDVTSYLTDLVADLQDKLGKAFDNVSAVATVATSAAAGLVADGLTLTTSGTTVLIKTSGVTVTHLTITGNLDFNTNQALQFRVENRGDDTGCTQTGRLWFRTDV